VRVACLFLSAGLLATTAAASDFAGTWKRDDSQSKLIPPPTITIEPKGTGWHVRWSTGPDYDVIPDGSEHPVTGNNIFQTEVSRRVDARTLEQDGKRGGKDAGKIVWTVSADGKELHQHTDGTYPNGASYRNDSYYRLVKGGSGSIHRRLGEPAGANPILISAGVHDPGHRQRHRIPVVLGIVVHRAFRREGDADQRWIGRNRRVDEAGRSDDSRGHQAPRRGDRERYNAYVRGPETDG
jgi:hypothetical protein